MLEKHPDARDVFIKPETSEDIEKINELNDLNSKRIKKNRTRAIREKGRVAYHKFDDVQQDLQNDIAAAQ